MGIPQFRAEGTDQNGTTTSVTPSFAGFTFQANDIIEIIFVTDGTLPTLSTANGFAIAQDPNGNLAQISTSGGTAGAAECSVTVFWKRAAGTGDSPPVISTNSATCWCLQPNSFSGARTSGTPYTAITSGIVSTATTAVTSQAATWSLANCLLMPRVASAEDDQAFNNWTMTGSSGPSGTGAPNTGWHVSNGNSCAFTGDEGGYATGQSGKTATTTFATSTKQAMVTLVMASVAEPLVDDTDRPPLQQLYVSPQALTSPATADEAPAQSSNVPSDDASPTPVMLPSQLAIGVLVAADELPVASSPTIVDEDPAPVFVALPVPQSPAVQPTSDELGLPVILDDDPTLRAMPVGPAPMPWALAPDDDLPGATAPSGVVDDVAPIAPVLGTSLFLPLTQQSGDELPPQPVALALGVVTWREKANTTTPNTGTLTTLTANPAWTASTSYQIINDTRVANSGNSYEVATSGTSASSGGPSGTPAPVTNGAITDNGAKWNWLAAGNGAVDTQSTGSLFLVSLGRGKDSTSGTVPRDNKSNTYSIIGSKNFFAGFPESSAASYLAALPSSGGTGHTISADWGAGGDGGGDEISIMFVEVIGGTKIQDHSQGEFSPNGSNVVTSASVTTTGPAILVCFCWLNGTVHADGFLHTATPGSGFTALPLASGLLEIANGAGQVQGATIYKQVGAAGTYTASITTGAGLSEGAVMHLIAVQGADVTLGVEDGAMPQLQIVAAVPLSWMLPTADEIAPTAALGGDEGQAMQLQAAASPVAVVSVAADELAITTVEDDVAPIPAAPVTAVSMPMSLVSSDEGVTVQLEESGVLPAVASAIAPVPGVLSAVDEVPPAVATPVDEDGAPLVSLSVPTAQLVVVQPVDEVPLPVIIDEDGAPRFVPFVTPVPFPPVPLVDEVPTVIVASIVDDDAPLQQGAAAVVSPIPQRTADDELPVIAHEDDGPIQFAPRIPVPPPVYTVGGEDDIPVIALFDESGALLAMTWSALLPAASLGADDELPVAVPPPPPLVDDDPAPVAMLWLPLAAVTASVGGDDALPIVPIPPVDPTTAWEDAIYQWVRYSSGLSPDHVIWTDVGSGGPSPAGLYISMRIVDVDSVSDDWLISRREGDGIVHHARGTRHPMLELTCYAGDSTGARRAELVLARVTAALELPSVGKMLRKGDVGVGTFGKVRVLPGLRSGMLDPRAMVEVQLHIKIDVSEAGGEFESVDVTTPGGVTQKVEKP